VSFAGRLHQRIRRLDTRVCLGIDPRPEAHASTDPAALDHDPARIARAVVQYFREVIDATEDLVACYKPQSAFFEALGIPGLIALAQLTADIRGRGIPVIMDAKRGDIGSTAEAYARTYLDSGVFASDALTINPYLGRDSLIPFTDQALQSQRGVFILVRTSNPGSSDYQQLEDASAVTVAQHVAAGIREFGEEAARIGALDADGYSHAGAVVGLTLPEGELADLRARMPRAILLLPGYGAQGGSAAAAAAGFDADGLGAVVSASRSLTYFGFEADAASGARSAATLMRDDLNAAIAATAR
jgi:orotidine-5'-phosphate decarboxylase